jgi:hypothetical protein
VSAAAQLKLSHSIGSTIFDDEIAGIRDGFRTIISYVGNYELQKPETLIRMFLGRLVTEKNLSSKELLARYDESVKTYGVVSDDSLSENMRLWFLGHRRGIGTRVVNGVLLFSQLYIMDEPSDIILISNAMVITCRQLEVGSKRM